MKGRIKLTQAAKVLAKVLGISFRKAQSDAYSGAIPTIISATGRRFVLESWLETQLGKSSESGTRCAIYSRESSSENKAALRSQTDGLRSYAKAKGWVVKHVAEEFGSGVNDQRKKLRKLLEERDFSVLLVEHKDRLTRFGFNWFEVLSPFKIEVVNVAEDETSDLMEDLVAILTSFSARLYGQRRGRSKTRAAIAALTNK